MPLVQTRGAASAQGFGEFAQAAAPAVYVEDVFSTYLYTGNGTTQTITNGIDLAGKGGLVWTKQRSSTRSNNLVDTVRGGDNMMYSNTTDAQFSLTGLGFSPFTFSSTGFVASNAPVNAENGTTFCSWTFREQAKFFDVVTYTGNGAGVRFIPHSLGSTPGLTFLKKTSTTSDWIVNGSIENLSFQPLYLNTTAARDAFNQTGIFTADASIIGVGAGTGSPNFGSNENGVTYVAYLFASNAGGFGAAGTDNVISCGSYTGNGSSTGPSITLGYEPQYVMIKPATIVQDWFVADVMRGMPVGSGDRILSPNLSDAETSALNYIDPTATGFNITSAGSSFNSSGETYIYMAIRRPMKPPTSGTEVFSPITSADVTGTVQTTGFPIDLQIAKYRAATYSAVWSDRLRGVVTTPTNATARTLESANTDAEKTSITATRYWNNTGFQTPTGWNGNSVAFWSFRRAPGFFDTVCYTGNDTAGRTVTHNLGAVPELMIVKARSAVASWRVYTAATGNGNELILNNTDVSGATTNWNSTTPTSSVFSLGGGSSVNASGTNYVAYLFATVAGVSKVGSYTGTGTLTTINCGFTGGARFLLIKSVDQSSNWWIWDTARGMVSGTDPSILLNTTAAENNSDSVYTISTGFQLLAAPAQGINNSGENYIFLAIA